MRTTADRLLERAAGSAVLAGLHLGCLAGTLLARLARALDR